VKSIGRNSYLPSLPLFLRGGQQHDEYTAPSEETGFDGDVHKLDGTQPDEEPAASIEMTKQTLDVDESSIGESAPSTPSSLAAATVLAPVSSILQTAATFYTQQLSIRPILTKSATAAVIFGLSDWVAQLIERKGDTSEKKEPIALSRIVSALLVGLLFFGPAANAWYEMIFKVLPSTSLLYTLQKAALGQIFFGPAFTCVFFGAGMIENGTFSIGGWVDKIKNDLPGVWASGLGFWPLVDFVSYKVVPVQWIPLFVNFCSFIWTIYLSSVANRSKAVE
jgi:protein Mpv17